MLSIPKLTNNAIYNIMVNKEIVQSLILQVIQIKEMISKKSVRMFKVALSDGTYYTPALLSSKLTEKIDSGDIQKNSIVVINDYYLLPSLNKDRLIIRNIDLFCLFSTIIGEPSPISSYQSPVHFSQNTVKDDSLQLSQENNQMLSLSQKVVIQPYESHIKSNLSLSQSTPPPPKKIGIDSQKQILNHTYQDSDQNIKYENSPNQNIKQYSTQNLSQTVNQRKTSSQNLCLIPNQDNDHELIQQSLDQYINSSQNAIKKSLFIGIDYLNPYVFNWAILVRVTMKSPIYNFETREGNPGKLFNITMKDKTGSEIRGTFYNEQVDTFYPIIDQDGVYEISEGLIREKNPKFNYTSHEYEIAFNSSTKVQPMPDDHTIGKLTYQFQKLSTLPNISPKTPVDILCYVISVSPIQNVTFKNNKTVEKRELVICDDSNVKCDMTLWDEMAVDFPNEGGFIAAFKFVKLSEFKGRTLSSPLNIALNPSFYQAEVLKEWIDENLSKSDFDFSKMATISNGKEMSRSFIFLSQINDIEFDANEKPDYGTAFVSLNDIFLNKKLCYAACPNPDCKFKGLIRTENGSYFCQKCQKITLEPAFRYIFSAKIQDFTGLSSVNIISDDHIGALFTGMTADDWCRQTNGLNETETRMLIRDNFFKPLKVRCRIKSDNFNDKKSIITSIISADELNFAEGALFFANEIEKYS